MKIEISITCGDIHFISVRGKRYFAAYDLGVGGTAFPGKNYHNHIVSNTVIAQMSKECHCICHKGKVYVDERDVRDYIVQRTIKHDRMKAEKKKGYATLTWSERDAETIFNLFSISVPSSNKTPKCRVNRHLVPLMLNSKEARKLYTLQGAFKSQAKLQDAVIHEVLTSTEYKSKETADSIEEHWND